MNVCRFFSRTTRALLCITVFAGVRTGALAQSQLEKTLKQFDANSVQGYIQPLADVFGANMNAGFYHSADLAPTGLHVAFDIVAMGSNVGDDQKSYTVTPPAGYPQFKTATIFGGDKTVVSFPPDTSLKFSGIAPGLVNTTLFPLATPQLTIGYLYGTSATIRFVTIPSSVTKDLGTITLFGLGAQHSVSQYLPDLPVDLAGGLFYTRFSVGDYIKFNSFAIGAQASKKFSVLAVYGGLQYENSSMNLQYISDSPNAPNSQVDITLDGANKFRFTVGAGLDLMAVHLFADANFGSITNFSAGIGFGGY